MKTTLLTLGLALAIASCSSAKKEEKAETKEAAKTEVSAPSSGISDYMALKDALVQTDASAAKGAAAKLAESATSENWSGDIVEAAKTIASSDDVEVQRTAFKTVTDGLIASLKANDSEDGVYVQFCPMAFDNTGASWLSMSDQIRNPYYGDKMLKCGKVTEEL
ncbi:DUF3347 domain-containing protein [Ekhidna sp.]|uniref:DUF3347 domain-containing protein n=1 Tax=Ekhidna sp. TaxID=2608089 RepID=UPI003B511257